jgi:gliding motility-associated-like protein
MYAQPISPLAVEWQRTWGAGAGFLYFTVPAQQNYTDIGAIYMTADSNYVFTANGDTYRPGDVDPYPDTYPVFMVCVNKTGKKLWEKQISLDAHSDFVQTNDGNFAILGEILNGTSRTPCIVKVNPQGGQIWRKYYPPFGTGPFRACVPKLKAANDGGFFVAGCTVNQNAGVLSLMYPQIPYTNDAVVFRTNPQGNMLWSKVLGGTNDDFARGMVELPNGNLVVAITTYSYDYDLQNRPLSTIPGVTQEADTWLCKISTTGNLYGRRLIRGENLDIISNLALTTDNNLLLCGVSDSYTYDYPPNMGIIPANISLPTGYVMKLDTSFQILWRKRKGGTGENKIDWISEDTDGNYISLGSTNAQDYNAVNNLPNALGCFYHLWLMKWDKQGNVLWHKFFATDANAVKVMPTPDNGYLVQAFLQTYRCGADTGGSTCLEWFHPGGDVYIVKLKNEPPPPRIAGNTNIACNASTTLTAIQDEPLPTPPVAYLWSTGDTTQSLVVTPTMAGQGTTYTVTITYDNHCTKTVSLFVNVVGNLSFPNPIILPALCTTNNGSATISADGGVVPYTYLWSNGSSFPAITNLAVGVYTVTATDTNGCTGSTTITIPQQTTTITATATTTPSGCTPTGSATLTVQNGTPPFAIAWSGSSTSGTATSATNTVLLPSSGGAGGGFGSGDYTVTITDANGCTGSTTITIPQAANDLSAIATATQIPCAGGTGSISVSITNGIAPYTVNYTSTNGSNGSTTTTSNTVLLPSLGGVGGGFGSGDYSVLVRDVSGCTATATATINAAPLPLTANINVQNATCGLPNGSLTANINGGTAPYIYAWANGTSTTQPTLTGVAGQNPPSGGWGVTATDANACTVSATATITSNPPITATITTTPTKCYGEPSGSIAISNVQNAIDPVLYSLDNQTFSSTNPILNVLGGAHTVTVEDATGCKLTATANVAEGPRFTVNIGRDTLLNFGDSLLMIANTTSGFPVSPVTYSWTCAPAQDLRVLNRSAVVKLQNTTVCNLVVTDGNGCTANDALAIRIKDANGIFIPNIFTPNGDGANDEFVIFAGSMVENVVLLQVFDRWGALIHQKTDFAPNTPAWDGTVPVGSGAVGSEQRVFPSSVYVYRTEIRLRSGELKTLTGDVTLIR